MTKLNWTEAYLFIEFLHVLQLPSSVRSVAGRLTGNSKFAVGVNVRVCVFVSPVMEWHLSRVLLWQVRQAEALLQPENGLMDEYHVLYTVLHIPLSINPLCSTVHLVQNLRTALFREQQSKFHLLTVRLSFSGIGISPSHVITFFHLHPD